MRCLWFFHRDGPARLRVRDAAWYRQCERCGRVRVVYRG